MDQFAYLAAMLMACSGVIMAVAANRRARRLEVRVEKLEEKLGLR